MIALDVENAWSEEVERRIQEIESGRVQLTPAAEAIARARAAIKETGHREEPQGRRGDLVAHVFVRNEVASSQCSSQ